MRTLIIGDVHGCKDELEDLVTQFAFVRGKDRLFQTGDMINRGPDSLGAVKLGHQLGIRSVLGNHEARLLRIFSKPELGRTAKDQFYLDRLGADAEELFHLVKEWPLWIDDPDFLLIHAGVQPGIKHLAEMSPKIVTTIRTWDGYGENLDNSVDPPWFDCVHWPKTVVFGHWALGGLVIREGFRGLDTGCVYGKMLSAWCPEENNIYQVNARREYSRLDPQ
jgi:bis(5'-nucleosyl)-tetraphosphatase (symmetrical)